MSYDPVRQVKAKLAGMVMLAATLAAALALAACGKEGPPTPPLRAVPAPTKDLAAHQRGNRVLLSFTYPQTTPGGNALNGVTKVEVYEAVIPPPPPPKAPAKPPAKTPAGTTGGSGTKGSPPTAAGTPAPGSPAAAAAPGAPAAALAAPEALDPRQFESLAKVRLTLTSKDLGAATFGNLLVADLALPEPLPETPEGGPTRDYAVRTYGPKGDRSALSNQTLLRAKKPPQPPDGVTVTGQADGILVEWKPVPGAGGYAIYRRAATERFSSKPLAVVRPPEVKYLDQTARFGQSYIYSVTAVDPKQALVESAIKAEQEVRYVDRYPPPVPEELVAVAEAGRVRLVWRQSEAPDLAGYIVYRKGAATDEFVRLTAKPIAATSYVDTTVASGQRYDYRVTAIDQTGNESAPSTEVHVAVP
jgi:fibronectin type 3 domain-containing protein